MLVLLRMSTETRSLVSLVLQLVITGILLIVKLKVVNWVHAYLDEDSSWVNAKGKVEAKDSEDDYFHAFDGVIGLEVEPHLEELYEEGETHEGTIQYSLDSVNHLLSYLVVLKLLQALSVYSQQ